jgi:hypothetical protein
MVFPWILVPLQLLECKAQEQQKQSEINVIVSRVNVLIILKSSDRYTKLEIEMMIGLYNIAQFTYFPK